VDGDSVLFIAGSGDGGLAGAPTAELGLDVGFDEGEAWRAVFDDAGDGFAVRFTGAGERVSCLETAIGRSR
jgi:hypothetical protein